MPDVIDGAEADLAAEMGLQALRAARDQIDPAIKRADGPVPTEVAKGVLATLEADLDKMRNIAIALVIRRSETEGLLGALDCRTGLAMKVRAITKRVASDAAEIRRAQLRVAKPDEQRPTLRAAFGAPEDWPDYAQPEGFEGSRDGVVRLVETENGVVRRAVCGAPIMVVGRVCDVNTGLESLTLGYRRQGAWCTLTVPRSQARDARSIVPLCNHGLPVSSSNARALVDFLAACEDVSGLRATKVTTRIGWHGDTYVAGPGGEIELLDPDQKRAGWRARGEYEGWVRAMRHLDKVPVAWVLVYHGVAAVLLRFLDLGFCPWVDLAGPSGKGKTSAMKAAVSIIAYPDKSFSDPVTGAIVGGGIVLTWDTTIVGLEEAAASIHDAPLGIDDANQSAQSVDDRNRIVAHAAYVLPSGTGKTRGKAAGGTRPLLRWRNTVLSTAEKPIVANTEAGGARNRVLTIVESPVFPDRETAQALEDELKVHHGHLAPRVAEAALRMGAELKQLHRDGVKGWEARATADTRLLSTVAALGVAAYVVHEVLGVPRPAVDPFEEGGVIERALFHSIEEADQGDRALAVVREDLAKHPDAYYGSEECRRETTRDSQGNVTKTTYLPPSQGWHGVVRPTYVAVLPEVLKAILRAAKHDVEPVLKRWETDGTLQRGEGYHVQKNVQRGDKVVRHYVFPRDKFDLECV